MKIYTVASFMAVAGIAAAVLAAGNPQVASIVACMGLLLLFIGFLFAVRGFDVGSGRLTIQRFGRTTEIDLHDLVEATPVPDLARKSISLWSTRGMFGFIGYFYSSATGTYRAYITDSAKAVLLRFRTGKIVVVSPEGVDQFIEAVRQAAPPIDPREATAPKPIEP